MRPRATRSTAPWCASLVRVYSSSLTSSILSKQNFDSTLPLATSWTPFSPLCPPAPNYLALLASNSFTQLSFLRNQTVFLIGDSVDRNALEHFSDMLGRGRWESAFGNATRGAEVAEDWKGKARPFVVEVDELGLIVTNGFLFGLVSGAASKSRASRQACSPLACTQNSTTTTSSRSSGVSLS